VEVTGLGLSLHIYTMPFKSSLLCWVHQYRGGFGFWKSWLSFWF